MHRFDQNKLSQKERTNMLKRFPNKIKLSYEIVSHKKVSVDIYDVGIAVPYGQHAYIWWTFHQNNPVCCVCEIDRTNSIGERVYFVEVPIPEDFMLGTIISGYFLPQTKPFSDKEPIVDVPNTITSQKTFLIDNIYMYKGVALHTDFSPVPYQTKMHWLCECIQSLETQYIVQQKTTSILFSLPYMWKYDSTSTYNEPPLSIEEIGYPVRHIQYMNTIRVCPLLNVGIHKKPVWNPTILANDKVDTITEGPTWAPLVTKHLPIIVPQWNLAVHKPIYRNPVHFWVKAELSDDSYHLYAKKSRPYHHEMILYQYAFIPNMKTSVMMNHIFRKIKENQNLDYIEESDDEDDFENIQEDRFVDLQKTVLMECVFHRKFRKWIPIRPVDKRIDGFRTVPYLDQMIIR